MDHFLIGMRLVALFGGVLLVGFSLSAYGDDTMTLDAIAQGLAKTPPHTGDNGDRLALYNALDSWVKRPDVVFWTGQPDTANPDLLKYYLACIEKTLTEAAVCQVDSGAVVWKLYSSGFLVKTPGAVFAIDVVEGPFKDIDRSPEDNPEFVFKWDKEMRARFAALVDVLFITHWHYDHASFALAEALGKAGKTIVVPEQLRKHWEHASFAPHLRVLSPNEDHAAGALTVRTFDGVQYMVPSGDDGYGPGNDDPQNNVYLIRAKSGISFLANGDNRGRCFTPWLKTTIEDGWQVDVWFKALGWPKTLQEDVEKIARPLTIPGHEYELGHKPDFGVNALADYYYGLGEERFKQGRAVLMSWGEKFHFAK